MAKFKVKVGKGGGVTVQSKPLRKKKGKKRVVKVKVSNRELSELGGRPHHKELSGLGGRPI